MSDGREERDEQEQRRRWEEQEDAGDLLEQGRRDKELEWEDWDDS
jgi:hypothetical protein